VTNPSKIVQGIFSRSRRGEVGVLDGELAASLDTAEGDS